MKLKALRPQVGGYGAVDTGAVIEIDGHTAQALIKAGHFVEASAQDLDAAKSRQDAIIAGSGFGSVGPAFAPLGNSLVAPLTPVEPIVAGAAAPAEPATVASGKTQPNTEAGRVKAKG